jgi:ubiquitin carboxyl-terminal hydrolase 7
LLITLFQLCSCPTHIHSRRILLFPFGNSNAPPNDTVSVYLDYANPKGAPEGWHACAQFALVISNIHDPTIYTVSRMYFPYLCRPFPH